MSSEQTWRAYIKNLETRTRVGIHPHEREPQRVIVNATIEARYTCRPQSISDCFNYDHLHDWVVKEWPTLPHAPLLEMRVTGLLEHIFRADPRVEYARVSLCKPDIFSDAEAVGVEAEWTRADFERLAPEK